MKPAELLMIPGPTPLPDAVREALARPAMAHRGAEFKKVLERVFPKLQWVFQTKQDVFLYSASATGAIEAALMNTLNPGDKVVSLINGVFSERWADIAEGFGAEVQRITVPHGEANTVESLETILQQDTKKEIKAVTVAHSETSTGVLNPIREMVETTQRHGALFMVDAVTSLTTVPFEFDGWGIDLAVSGSQKGFMIPPGISFLAVSERAWEAFRNCRRPGYYFNFKRTKKAQDEFTTPYTPATPQIVALDVALKMMEAESLEGMIARHRRLQTMVRAGVEALGLTVLVPDEAQASVAVTAILCPEGLTVSQIRSGLKERYGIVVADGQKDLKGKIFRIGHLGYVSEREVLMTLAALENVLDALGRQIRPGAGVAAAINVGREKTAQYV